MSRALVTGASGFLGRRLVAALLREGAWNVSLVLQSQEELNGLRKWLPVELRGSELEYIEGDLADIAAFTPSLQGFDAICHLAAYIPLQLDDSSHAQKCLRLNSLATLELAELALRQEGRNCRFVYYSAANAYSQSAGPVNEESPLYPSIRATYYLSSKIVGDIYVEHLRHSKELNSVVLRISVPYGWDPIRESVVTRFLDRASRGLPLEVLDGGTARYDFVHWFDVVDLTLKALRGGPPGVYNVASGQSYSIAELAEAVAELFPEHGIVTHVTGSPPEGGGGFPPLSIRKAFETWNYRPLSLREGLIRSRTEMLGA